MKKHLLAYFPVLAFTFSGFITLHAQSIHVVPNPTAPNAFTYSNNSGALSGYSGTPIILNNSLVLEYNPTTTSDPTQIKLQLAVYTVGDSLHLITNPDAGQGVYFNSVQLIFNNKLFFIYLNAAGLQQLASFDGTSITLYPNPDAGLGYIGSPRIFNNTLYVAYNNAVGIIQFGKFNGAGITLIPNPDNSQRAFNNNYSVVFGNKICSRYVTADGTKHLATFDGTQWTVLPNPDNTTDGVVPQFPAVYHNKLYFYYLSATNQYQFLQYDGVNNPTLIANPQNANSTMSGVSGFPIVFNDTLFFQYYNTSSVLQLAKFGGTSITLVPNPDASPNGFYNTPIVYNSNLYIFYVTADNLHHLAQYQGASNSLKVFPNPDSGPGYWDQPIVYDNNLYFEYANAQSRFQLGYFDGTSLKLISNPAGAYNGYGNTNGYLGYPVIWNNLLYMQFGSVPYKYAGNLAYFDGSALPITLLSFTAQPDAGTSILQWKTASEVNNAYFAVEHSLDGTTFQPVGTVTGHGTVTTQQAYRFIDNTPSKGVNYYRLKQVDYDGHFTYSNIATVNFENVATAFKIFPNPAVNSVNISLPPATVTSVIEVYDLSGKKVMEKQIDANTVSKSLDVSMLPAGVYQLRLMQGTQQQTIKLVKE